MADEKERDEDVSESSTDEDSTDEQTDSADVDRETNESGSEAVPYDRFKEVNQKAKQAAEEAAKYKQQLEQIKKATGEKPAEDDSSDDDTDDPLESALKLRAEGFSDQEILDLRKQARQLNVPVKTLLQNETFKQGIEARRKAAKEQQAVEQATPSPTSRTVKIGDKSWDDMSPQEQRAHHQEMVGQYAGRGSKTSE